ncbi:MAG TPA: alpha/beta fold hydrolase [Nocardioidaceae bacterium]|nr:alpha/beta fold hydrolase [Nocardioidaceae bacterium]
MAGTHDTGQHAPEGGRRVASAGVSLAVREYGAPPDLTDVEHVVLVHGYPDSQDMWTPVAGRLAGSGMHVVTYDVRGAGASDVPARTEDYRVGLLVDDLVAVLDATVPEGDRVHLVGHDWGSVQLWEAVLSEADDPRLLGRIASFTSVSGPAMDHLSYLSRHPKGRTLKLLRQLGHSWYVFAFQVPVLPELAWRTAARPVGALAARMDRAGATMFWGPELAENAAHGVNLYRANLRRGTTRDRARRTDVPVLTVAPLKDPYLTGVTVEDLDHLCSDVRVVRPDTGHWLPRTHPDLLADLVREHVRAHA